MLLKTTLKHFGGRRNAHYFLNTGALTDIVKGLEEKKKWADQLLQGNHFYYTDTVKREFEASGLVASRSHFTFVPANLPLRRKNHGFSHIKPLFQAKTENLEKFEADLFIVMEAGYCCYDVLDINSDPTLLTQNMKFYKRFILYVFSSSLPYNSRNPENRAKLEEAINLYGMEHLIEVESLDGLLGFIVNETTE